MNRFSIKNIMLPVLLMLVSAMSFANQTTSEAQTIVERMSEIKGAPIVMPAKNSKRLSQGLSEYEYLLDTLKDQEVETLFLMILSMNYHGLAVSNNVYSIVPTKELPTRTKYTLTEGETGSMFGLAVIDPGEVLVEDLLAIIRPIVSSYATITLDKATNSILIMDHADNVERIRQLVKVINDKK